MGLFDIFKKTPPPSKEMEELDAKADALIPEMEAFYKKNTDFFGSAKVQEVLIQMRDSDNPRQKLELLDQAYKLVSDVVYTMTNSHYHEARRKIEHEARIKPLKVIYDKIKAIYEEEIKISAVP